MCKHAWYTSPGWIPIMWVAFIHSYVSRFVIHLFFASAPLHLLIFWNIKNEKQVPWKGAHSHVLEVSPSVQIPSPLSLGELLKNNAHVTCFGRPAPHLVASLCSHTPVLPCVMTSIMLNYNGQPTCPFSLYTVNLALDVALHEHSIWFLWSHLFNQLMSHPSSGLNFPICKESWHCCILGIVPALVFDLFLEPESKERKERKQRQTN